MRIKSVEFAGAIGQVGQAQPEAARGVAQVAFAGRSNVGKSSLINRLLGRTRTAIARVSQQPGKTQEINFYRVRADEGDFFLVDLPGYGYARVPQELRVKWQPLINGYLSKSSELTGVVQLVDLRTGPSPDDLKAVDYLAELGVPVMFAFTKADKLTRTEREKAFAKAVKKLGIDPEQAIAFSALKGDGREELLDTLGSLLFPAPGDAAEPGEGDNEEPPERRADDRAPVGRRGLTRERRAAGIGTILSNLDRSLTERHPCDARASSSSPCSRWSSRCCTGARAWAGARAARR